MVVVVFQEELFIREVASESDCCYTQAWKRMSESLPSCKRARISPSFTVQHLSIAARRANGISAYFLAQGSFAGVPAALARSRGLKPVRFGFGAIVGYLGAGSATARFSMLCKLAYLARNAQWLWRRELELCRSLD